MITDVEEIESLLERLEAAIAAGDGDALERLLSPDVEAVFTGGEGPVRGREAVMVIWRRHLGAWQEVTLSRRETVVRIHGDAAWARFRMDGEGSTPSARYRLEGERWTVVMLWEEDSWKIVQSHSSMPYRDWESHRISAR